jgi:hypothetical protein
MLQRFWLADLDRSRVATGTDAGTDTDAGTRAASGPDTDAAPMEAAQ